MNNKITYRPYKSHIFFAYFMLCIGLFSFIVVGHCLPQINVKLFLFFAMGVLCIATAKWLYDSSNLIVCFEQDGFHIFDSKYSNCHSFHWHDFPYAYYTKNFKCNTFLLLSPNVLSKKQMRLFTSRGANLSQIYTDSVVVLYIDSMQNTSYLKELIHNKVIHIEN